MLHQQSSMGLEPYFTKLELCFCIPHWALHIAPTRPIATSWCHILKAFGRPSAAGPQWATWMTFQGFQAPQAAKTG